MTFPANKFIEFVYKYDFAVDGGAIGAIALRALTNALEAGLIITEFEMLVEETFTSGGSATVILGNSVDDDGYSVDIFAALAAGAVIRSGQQAGALLWDNTNDNELSYKIPSVAGAIPYLKVGTAALTAGKATFVFKAIRIA